MYLKLSVKSTGSEFVKKIIELKVKRLSILRLVLHGRAFENKDELLLNKNYLNDIFTKAQKINRENGKISIRMGSPFNEFRSKISNPCSAGKKVILIRPDGWVYPCVGLKHLIEFNNGNYIYKNDLIEIWNNSDIFKRIREIKMNSNKCITQCLTK